MARTFLGASDDTACEQSTCELVFLFFVFRLKHLLICIMHASIRLSWGLGVVVHRYSSLLRSRREFPIECPSTGLCKAEIGTLFSLDGLLQQINKICNNKPNVMGLCELRLPISAPARVAMHNVFSYR